MQDRNQPMCKIYSRNRLNIFKNKKLNRNKKKSKSLFYLPICIFIILIYFVVSKSISPIFDNICEDKAKSIAINIINNQTVNEIKNYTYDDLFSIEKDKNGNIQMINANIFIIDKITSNITTQIQGQLENNENSVINIAIGSFLGINILSGVGPTLPIRIVSSGKVDTDLKSEFISQGINQTLHRIYLQINCQVSILTPFKTIKQDIISQVLLSENVIIGQIPSYYNKIDEK